MGYKKIINKSYVDNCPKCNSDNLIYDSKDSVEYCKDCNFRFIIKPIKFRLQEIK